MIETERLETRRAGESIAEHELSTDLIKSLPRRLEKLRKTSSHSRVNSMMVQQAQGAVSRSHAFRPELSVSS